MANQLSSDEAVKRVLAGDKGDSRGRAQRTSKAQEPNNKSGKEEEDRGSLARLEGRQARLSQCRVFTPEEFHSISSTTEA